jgi:hypothetical protein
MKTCFRLFISLALVAFAGCSTIEKRIEEKSSVFASLDPQTQGRLQQGIVAVGDTTDMVYIALGRPDEIREKTTADSDLSAWIYNNYWQEYEGSRLVGFQRRVFYNPATRTYRSYYEPVHVDVYRDRTEERTRVTFKDGKVTVIEQAKD